MGTALFDNQSVPTTPAAGKSRLYVDSTTKRPISIDDAGLPRGTFLSGNDSTAQQVLPASNTYVTNSGVLIPSMGMKAGMLFRWYMFISKTAAGTGAPIFTLKIGAAQSTADTTRATITGVAQTAAVDTGVYQFFCHVRTVSATGQLVFSYAIAGKQAANAVGFGSASQVNIPSTFDNSALAGQYVGIAIDPVATGTPVWTIDMVECKLTG